MPRKKKRYTEYDTDSAFKAIAYRKETKTEKGISLNSVFVENLLRNGLRCEYITKEVIAGNQLEVEIYPEFTRKRDIPKEVLEKRKETQKNLNDKNARKKVERLLNNNFSTDDLWLTCTYDERHYPENPEEAYKNVKNFIGRINYRRKKEGLPKAKYIYITEWKEHRCHHHLVMDSGLDIETVFKTWGKGKKNKAAKLDYDEYGITGLAKYITKDPEGKKRWGSSIGLEPPKIRKNHKFRRKKVEKLVKDHDRIRREMEKEYKDYWFTDTEVYYNEFNCLFYIYTKMRRKE